MKENYYYCYSTNSLLLGEMSRKHLKKIKHQENLHDFTVIISTILSLSSVMIDSATKSINITIQDPHFNDIKLAKTLYFNLSLRPLVESIKEDLPIDEEYTFKKITTRLENDNFQELSDFDFGDVLKYTSYLNLNNNTVNTKSDFNKLSTELAIKLFHYIRAGNLKRDEKLQLPIGKEIFNLKLNCTANYYD